MGIPGNKSGFQANRLVRDCGQIYLPSKLSSDGIVLNEGVKRSLIREVSEC